MNQQNIAWIDGILIKPEHFEQQERAFKAELVDNIDYLQNYFFGINQLKINKALLKHNKIQLLTLSGRFQDGTTFTVQNNTLSRMAIEINDVVADETIYLGLPLNDYITEKDDPNKRFTIEEIEAANTLSPNEPSTPILVRELNLCLLREKQNRKNYLTIPLLKIKKSDLETGIVLDENFIPASLNVKNNTNISQDLNVILSLLERKQQQLANTLVTPLQSRNITSSTDVALLQLLNASLTKLQHQQALSQLHPYDLYQSYVQLLAELGTFYSENRLAIKSKNYQHFQLTDCFSTIKQTLIDVLQTKFEHQATSIPLTLNDDDIYHADLTDKQLLSSSNFVLLIRHDVQKTPNTILEQIKISSNDDLNNIVHLQLSGVALEALNLVPPQLPYYEDATYLQIIKKGERWNNIENSQSLSIYLESVKDANLQLWAIPELATQTGATA